MISYYTNAHFRGTIQHIQVTVDDSGDMKDRYYSTNSAMTVI